MTAISWTTASWSGALGGRTSMAPAPTTPRSLALVRDPATRSAPRLVARPRAFGTGDGEGLSSGQREREDEINEDGVVRTLLIDNYDSYTYNIYQELSVVNGVPPVVVLNDDWTWECLYHWLYKEMAFDNIVISPGPGTPKCPADVGVCHQIFLECKDIPVLGVCLGHQALGFVHGAQIIHAPEPIHGRLSEIEHTGCDLFKGIPTGTKSGFKVVRYHSLVIDSNSLPEELIPIAWTTSGHQISLLETQKFGVAPDGFADKLSIANGDISSVRTDNNLGIRKILMGIRHSTRPHYGVQFHPESIATRYGRQIFRNFKKMTINHGLRRSLLHERKVAHACQFLEKFPRAELLQKATIKQFGNIYETSTVSPTLIDANYLRLQWKKFDSLLGKVGGSENIFHKLFGDQNLDNTFWLDSSSTDKGRARFSFMGGKGGSLWKQLTFFLCDNTRDCQFGHEKRLMLILIFINKTCTGTSGSDKFFNTVTPCFSKTTDKVGGYLTIEDSNGSFKTDYIEDGLFDFLDKELQSFIYDKRDYQDLPFDFCCGYIGYLGYDLKVECGAPFNRHKSRTPDACFFFADKLVAIDHWNGDVYLLSLHKNLNFGTLKDQDRTSNEDSWLVDTEKKLLSLRSPSIKKLNKQKSCAAPNEGSFVIEKSKSQYIKDINKCQQLIEEGESYELCLTTQMRRRVDNINSLALYLKLRNQNPAPYAAWLNFTKEDLCICCSSPERFLRLDGDGILEAKPIKGTVARGRTQNEDDRLRLQLQYSEKDQAENLMIVDLLRNDLGRVCKPGTVHVPRLMEVESYATVHTLVSTIQGKRKPDASPIDCVRAAFPGGSMTGAPKIRSMVLLDSLESCSRGIYSGSIGFFSYNQTFDLNIVIRTVVMHKGEASVGAGGAITSLSEPEEEYAEMMLKAKAPTGVVEECSRHSDTFGTSLKMVS